VSAACVASTVCPSPMSLLVCGMSSVAARLSVLLLSSSTCRFGPWPWNAWPSSATSVRSDCCGTDVTRVLMLVRTLVIGGGTAVSCSGIIELEVR